MPHIALPSHLPGIRAAMAFRPETAQPLNDLVDALLTAPNSLTPAERELIATYVSRKNDCYYCATIHGAVAAAHLDGDEDLVRSVKADFESAEISPKLKALLNIAGKVQLGGKHVSGDDIARARAEGVSDVEIHDTVLIAAAFCTYNRYVDGLATVPLDDDSGYAAMAPRILEHGYAAIPTR